MENITPRITLTTFFTLKLPISSQSEFKEEFMSQSFLKYRNSFPSSQQQTPHQSDSHNCERQMEFLHSCYYSLMVSFHNRRGSQNNPSVVMYNFSRLVNGSTVGNVDPFCTLYYTRSLTFCLPARSPKHTAGTMAVQNNLKCIFNHRNNRNGAHQVL